MFSRGLLKPAERQCHICALGLSRQRRAWLIASRQVSTTTAVEKQQRAFPSSGREEDRVTYESFASRLGSANVGRHGGSDSKGGPGVKPRGFDQRGQGQRRSRRPNHGRLPNETKPAPSLEQLRNTLIRRLEPWIYSETTLKKLDSLGIGIEDAEALLNDFQGVATKSLKDPSFGAIASQTSGSLGAPFALEWDVEGLTLSFQHDADWMKSVERAYLRQFLRWATHEQTTGMFSLPEPLVVRIREILETTDLSHLASQFNEAREMHRQFHLHIGPTNSGKTYNALKALAKAKTGAYAGPLRLLAHEVWERMNRGTVGGLEDGQGRECNLITGEERRIVSLEAGLTSCTVEMLSFNTPLDVVVIDEIQMIGDPQRGGSWTNAVMGLLAKEIHLCGEETVVPVIQKLVAAMGDELVIHRYERLTPLKVLNESLGGDLSKVEDGDCVVSFSRSGIFALKKTIEEKRGKRCAVVYGALPPETRSEQARLFNEPGNGIDVMVASDAVGMGLNLKIKRIIFDTLHKWNGKEEVLMSFSQIKQIAGRAGRFGQHDAGSEGGVTTLNEQDLPLLRQILPSPLTPVPRAAIEPGYDRLARLALLLPEETPYANLLETYENLVHLSPACMPSAVLPHIKLSELLKGFTKDLTLKEMVTFGFAPVNLRDGKVVSAFQNYVSAYVNEGEVLLESALESGRLVPNLELVEKTSKTMHSPSESETRAGAVPSPIPATIVTAIPGLESLHKALVLYLWLSFRLPLNFPDRTAASELKLRTEVMLDFCLERLPGLKRKRGPKHYKRGSKAEQAALEAMPRDTLEKIKWIPREKIDTLKHQQQYGNLDVLPDDRL